jgi:hypothetical protein
MAYQGSGISHPQTAARCINSYAESVDSDSDMTENTPLTDYSKDGVDLTLIRWMLSLSPAERLRFHEQRINEILKIRALNARKQTSRRAEGSD